MSYLILPFPPPEFDDGNGFQIPMYDGGLAVYELAHAAWPNGRTGRNLDCLHGRLQAVLVKRERPGQQDFHEEHFAGFLLACMPSEDDYCYSPDIFVMPKHRGGTAGYLLMQEMIRQWKASNAPGWCHMHTFDKPLMDMAVKFFGFEMDEHFPDGTRIWELCGYGAHEGPLKMPDYRLSLRENQKIPKEEAS